MIYRLFQARLNLYWGFKQFLKRSIFGESMFFHSLLQKLSIQNWRWMISKFWIFKIWFCWHEGTDICWWFSSWLSELLLFLGLWSWLNLQIFKSFVHYINLWLSLNKGTFFSFDFFYRRTKESRVKIIYKSFWLFFFLFKYCLNTYVLWDWMDVVWP